jgi:hypothetical protein
MARTTGKLFALVIVGVTLAVCLRGPREGTRWAAHCDVGKGGAELIAERYDGRWWDERTGGVLPEHRCVFRALEDASVDVRVAR